MDLVSPFGFCCHILFCGILHLVGFTTLQVAIDGHVINAQSTGPPIRSAANLIFTCRRPLAKIRVRCQRHPATTEMPKGAADFSRQRQTPGVTPPQLPPNATGKIARDHGEATTATPTVSTTDHAAYSTRKRRNLERVDRVLQHQHHLYAERLTASPDEAGINIEVTPSNETVVTVYFGAVPPDFSVLVNLYDATDATSDNHAAVLIRVTSVTLSAYAGTITFISPTTEGHLHNSTVGFTIPLSPNGAVLTVDVPRDDHRILHLHGRTTKIRLVYLGRKAPSTVDGASTVPTTSGERSTPPLIQITSLSPRQTTGSPHFPTEISFTSTVSSLNTTATTVNGHSKIPPISVATLDVATTKQSAPTSTRRSTEFNGTLLPTAKFDTWTTSSSSTLPSGGATFFSITATARTTISESTPSEPSLTHLRSSSTFPSHIVTRTTTNVDILPRSTLPSTNSIIAVATATTTEPLTSTTHRFFSSSTSITTRPVSTSPTASTTSLNDLVTTFTASTRRTRNETSVPSSSPPSMPSKSGPTDSSSPIPEVSNATRDTLDWTAIETPANDTLIESSTIGLTDDVTNKTITDKFTCLCHDWLSILKTTPRSVASNVTTSTATGSGFLTTRSTTVSRSTTPASLTNATAQENITSGVGNATNVNRNISSTDPKSSVTTPNTTRTKTTTEKRNSDDAKWTTFFTTGPTIRSLEKTTRAIIKTSTSVTWPTKSSVTNSTRSDQNRTSPFPSTEITLLHDEVTPSGNRSTVKPRDQITSDITVTPTSARTLTTNGRRNLTSTTSPVSTTTAMVSDVIKNTTSSKFPTFTSAFPFMNFTQRPPHSGTTESSHTIGSSTIHAPEVTEGSNTNTAVVSDRSRTPTVTIPMTAFPVTTTTTHILRRIAPPSYWIRTVVYSEDQELDQTFESDMVVNLQNAYKEAFSRQHLEVLGVIKRTRLPRETNLELYAEIINATWSERENDVEIVYFLGHNNSLISAKRAVAAMDLMSEQEVAILFKHVILIKAEPYLKDPATEPLSDENSGQSVVLPAVLGSLVALLLIIIIAVVVYRCCCRKGRADSEESLERGRANRQDRFEEISHSILTVGGPEGAKALSGNPGTSVQRPLPSMIVTPPPIPKRTRQAAASKRPLPDLPRNDSYENVHAKRSTSTERLIEDTPPAIRRKSIIRRKMVPEEVYRTEYYEVDEIEETHQPGLLSYLRVPVASQGPGKSGSRAKSPVPSAIEQIAKVVPPSDRPRAKPRKEFRQNTTDDGVDQIDHEDCHPKANTSTQTETDGRHRVEHNTAYNRSISEPQSPHERDLIQAEIQMQTMRERMQDILDDAFTLLKSNKLSPRIRRNRLQPKSSAADQFFESEKSYSSLPNRSVFPKPSATLSSQTTEAGKTRDDSFHHYGPPRVSWDLAQNDENRNEDQFLHQRFRGSDAKTAPPTPAVRNSLITDVQQASPVYGNRRVVAPSDYDSPIRHQAEPAATFGMPASRRTSFQSLTPVLGDNEIDVVGRQLRSHRHSDPEAQYLIRTLKEELQKFRNNMDADYSLI